MRLRALVIVAMLVGACGDDAGNAGDGTSTGGAGTTTTSATATVGTGVDTGSSSSGGPVPEVVAMLDLELETLEEIDVVIVQTGDVVEAEVTVSRGFGVAPVREPLVGPARVDAFPEAGAILYTARLESPAQADGPCGGEPISLALSLHRDDDSSFVAGGLTPYCGAGVGWGVPVIEPLRISGWE